MRLKEARSTKKKGKGTQQELFMLFLRIKGTTRKRPRRWKEGENNIYTDITERERHALK